MRLVLVIGLLPVLTSSVVAAEGDPRRGQQLFQRACAACHSLKPDTNMTGPSLAGVWHRKAGGLPSFSRYSPAIKNAQLTWDDTTLRYVDENPAGMIPGNRMTFSGIKDAQARTDLLSVPQGERQRLDKLRKLNRVEAWAA